MNGDDDYYFELFRIPDEKVHFTKLLYYQLTCFVCVCCIRDLLENEESKLIALGVIICMCYQLFRIFLTYEFSRNFIFLLLNLKSLNDQLLKENKNAWSL